MKNLFSRLAGICSMLVGHPFSFILAILFVVAWAICGPIFKYSDTWQLVINTSTTILTFLMVFLLQNAQNRDSRAIHLKLDELLRALKRARNELIDLENLSEDEFEKYAEEFKKMHVRYAAVVDSRKKKPENPQ